MKLISIASGSSGNCTLVLGEKKNLLIDVGIPARAIEKTLALYGLSLLDIHAVLLTHAHNDHTKGLFTLFGRRALPVYAPTAVWEFFKSQFSFIHEVFRKSADVPFSVEDFSVTPFRVPHDVECNGYVISEGEDSIAFATDVGVMERETLDHLVGARMVVLESNYDETMLKFGPYPPQLKRRISSSHGHLSNADCAKTVLNLVKNGTREILLAHLSEENNLPELAFETCKKELSKEGFVEGIDYFLYVTGRHGFGRIL